MATQGTPRKSHGHDQALASDTFDKLCNASNLKDILALYRQLCFVCKLVPTNFQEFFPKIRGKIPSWRAEELWSRFEKKAGEKCYARGRYCANTKVLIIGAGPCGLRAAIDAQLLGAKVVVIEKREKLSRNNVLHLWPFVISDLRALGAKALYGKFCAGSIDHISIRQIQCILLKVALLLGVEFHEGVGFSGLREPSSSSVDDGWRAAVTPPSHPVSQYQFDVVLGADGRKSILSKEGFKRKALRAKLAIAITANFINKHTEAEAKVEEISGVSYIFRQQFFQDLDDAMGIALENIVYYKDETHYFVMTPKKQSLLEKGVLYQDFPEPELLLSPENVDQEALQRFTMEAIVFATDNRLPCLEFALNHYGQPDVAVFDFTTMYASENACRAVQRKGHKLLIGLIGDALLEPFWPTGSGCARGFLGSYDAAWMIRQWGKGLNSVLEVLAERESIYRLLGQTTPENLAKDHSQYNIDPRTRYPKINLSAVNARQIPYLFDSDTPITDIFDPIRSDPNNKAMREFVMPEELLVRWLQEQLSNKNCNSSFSTICDIFNGATALQALLHRYRPDLIPEYPLPENIDRGIRNQLLFEILQEEFDLHLPMDCEKSVRCGDGERSVLTRYLSQVYLRFKGDIPRDDIYESSRFYNANSSNNNKTGHQQYPNNSKLHHSLSIKEFLRGKEQLEKNRKEEQEENGNQSRREKRRSQFYDALMQSESQKNSNGGSGGVVVGGGLQRSQTSVNVVIPIVKLNPVPPGELFAACRQGRDKEIACESRPQSQSISTNPNAQKVLTRSRSDVGFRRGPSPALTMARGGGGVSNGGSIGIGPGHLRKSSSGNSHNITSFAEEQSTAEALEMQMKIMKRRTTPAGNIISTFMQKQAIAGGMMTGGNHQQNRGGVGRGGSVGGGGGVVFNADEQENWTKRQIRDMRARSLNNSTFNGWGKRMEAEEQKTNELNNHFKLKQQQQQQQQKRKEIQNNQQQQPLRQGPDVSFKDRCKFLEKNIYNSGRDFKVHCSAPTWLSQESSTATPRTTPTPPSPTTTQNGNGNMIMINKASSPSSPTSLIPGSGSGRAPLQKSPTTLGVVAPVAGGIPSTCFMASKKQQPTTPPPPQLTFINNKANENFTSINPFTQQQKFPNNSHSSNSNIPRAQQQQQQEQLSFQQQLQQQREALERKLGATVQGIKSQLVNPPQYHINGQIIHPGNGNGNNNNGTGGSGGTPADNNNNNPTRTPSTTTTTIGMMRQSPPPSFPNNYHQRTTGTTPPSTPTANQSRASSGSSSPNGFMSPQQQSLRRSATAIGVHNQNNVHHHQLFSSPNGNHHIVHSMGGRGGGNRGGGGGRRDSSGESDTDTDFLKQIDFETIDGQELQELLSSF